MPLTIFNLDCVSLERVFAYAAKRRATSPQYHGVDDGFILSAYTRAEKNGLKFNRKTNVTSDRRLGVIARPSNPSEWEEATPEEARDELCHEVWCDAVRDFNLRAMA